MSLRSWATPALALCLTVLTNHAALAASHLWVINEIFSNSDGTVQFIEMHVPSSAANETGLNGKWLLSTSTGTQFDFTENLPAGSTALAHLLLGTQAFADLPGAPTPDHILPSLFDLDADTIRYWLYVTGDITYATGELPLDGVTSLNRDGSTGVNSPTNFAGETGSVTVATAIADDLGAAEVGAGTFLRVLRAGGQGVDLEFQLATAGEAELSFFDASGRVVRRITHRYQQGVARVSWDGKDETGALVANGIYLVQLAAGGERAVGKIALVR
jgi:hypothetical protein